LKKAPIAAKDDVVVIAVEHLTTSQSIGATLANNVGDVGGDVRESWVDALKLL
jgi:hypothetical protein